MNPHLDRGKLRALLYGTLSPEKQQQIFLHLSDGCDRCEAVLGEMSEGEEAMLFRLVGRIERSKVHPLPQPDKLLAAARPARKRMVRLLAPAFAVAAMLVMAVLAWPLVRGERPSQRIKGQPEKAGPVVSLSLGTVEAGGEHARIGRVRQGARLRQDTTLVFRVTVDVPCRLALFRVGGDGRLETLLPARGRKSPLLESGSHVVSDDQGRPLGFSLEGLKGSQRFIATCVVGDRPADDRIRRLLQAASDNRWEDGAVSVVEVEIVEASNE